MEIMINANEYGLSIDKATQIEKSFAPMISEREMLLPMYDGIIKSEISPQLSKQAKELRLRLVKLRTSTDRIHKDEKAFFLAAGRFVDAWKNKNTTVLQEMETRLSEIENYYVNLEKARLAELKATRTAEILPFLNQYETAPENIQDMPDNVYNAYKSGIISAYNMRKEAEAKAEQDRIENEKKQNLYAERRIELAQYKQFWRSEYVFDVDTNEADYIELLQNLHNSKNNYEIEQEKIRTENEKLRKEAEEKDRLHREQLERERKEAEEKAKSIESELKAKADAERIEREKIESELAAKLAAEKAEKAELEKFTELELQKGDAAKFRDLISDLQEIKTKYSFKSKKNAQKYSDVQSLIDKIINHINS